MKKIVCLFFLINLCHGQVNNEAFAIKWINATNGLNQLTVRNCVEDNNGFIYIATEMGLYKYDGNKVVTVKDVAYPEISNKRIYFMSKDNRTGIIYFITDPDLKVYAINNSKIKQIHTIYERGVFISKPSFLGVTNQNKKMLSKLLNKDFYVNNLYNTNFNSMLSTSNYIYFKSKAHLECIDNKGNQTKIKDIKEQVKYLYNIENLLQFNNTTIFIDGNKASIIKDNKLINKEIKCDSVLNKFFSYKK